TRCQGGCASPGTEVSPAAARSTAPASAAGAVPLAAATSSAGLLFPAGVLPCCTGASFLTAGHAPDPRLGQPACPIWNRANACTRAPCSASSLLTGFFWSLTDACSTSTLSFRNAL